MIAEVAEIEIIRKTSKIENSKNLKQEENKLSCY